MKERTMVPNKQIFGKQKKRRKKFVGNSRETNQGRELFGYDA